MSKPKRRSLADQLDGVQPEPTPAHAVTSSRDNVVTLAQEASEPAPEARPAQERRPKGGVRHSYHASLYLPSEAQFALREIALMLRKPKPHDVMLEAMAELFERYNKRELAAECRRRMSA